MKITPQELNIEVNRVLREALKWHEHKTPFKPTIENEELRAGVIRSLASTFIHIIGAEAWDKLLTISDNLIEN